MTIANLFQFKNKEIKALHLNWIAFFICFYAWFNMAPLATTMIKSAGGWLTMDDIKLFAICNVALTIPARMFFGMLQDKFGPRKCFTLLMILMAIPCFLFAWGDSKLQLLLSRLFLSMVGASFSIGIHMTALWFKPKDVGFAEGFYAGWGNFGAAGAAMTLPWIALNIFGGDDGWRYAITANAVVMFAFAFIYYYSMTDGPKGTYQSKPRGANALEVSTWADMYKHIIGVVLVYGILCLLVWKIQDKGYMGETGGLIAYAALALLIIHQVFQVVKVNVPILKKGVPEDDKYHYNSVIALNATYFANFGSELAVVSMIPAFFEMTWKLTPATAGLIAASYSFVNLIARPLGGYLSDKFTNRKAVMIFYMLGIAAGYFLMGLMTSAWPLVLATIIVIGASFFVQGAEGATFGIVPMVKRRLTGQIAGMAGAYGNVGAVTFTFLYTFVSANTMFLIMAGCSAASALICLLWLKEPEGSFSEEYKLSSVDKALQEHDQKKIVVSPFVKKPDGKNEPSFQTLHN